MKLGYSFFNLLGSVYSGGPLVFSSDGNAIFCPVGNRVARYDLGSQRAQTLPFENKRTISTIAVSPNGQWLVSIDLAGHGLFVALNRGNRIVHYCNFKERVRCASFSPDGKILAVSKGRFVQLWQSPSPQTSLHPLSLLRNLSGHHDDVSCLNWSDDCKYLMSGGRDGTAILHLVSLPSTSSSTSTTPNSSDTTTPSSDKNSKTRSTTPLNKIIFSAHRDEVVSVQFAGSADEPSSSSSPTRAVSVARDGAVCVWKQDEEPSKKSILGHWTLMSKHFLEQNKLQGSAVASANEGENNEEEASKLSLIPHVVVENATYHRKSHLLTCSFSSGVVGLWTCIPGESTSSFDRVHLLTISSARLGACAINPTGEWIALGAADLGQLLVWEWKSESYILRQQAHSGITTVCAYSNDGQMLATGGSDGKVKIWNIHAGFCFLTFSTHKAPVTGIVFHPRSNAILTSSLDGTVQAYDLVRYRNFRTMRAETPQPFSCVCTDPTGDMVMAGSMNDGAITVWSLRTGKILETLRRHEGPISCLAFNPTEPQLASGSWDGSVVLWDLYGGKNAESLPLDSEVLALAFPPSGKELMVSTLKGDLVLWDLVEGNVSGTLSGRSDARGGRKVGDRRSASSKSISSGIAFRSLVFSADGEMLLCGGECRDIVLYHMKNRLPLRKYPLSANRDLSNVVSQLNSSEMTEAGPRALLPSSQWGAGWGETLTAEERQKVIDSLPGVVSGRETSSRAGKPVSGELGTAKSSQVIWAPGGRSWAAATPQGVQIFSLDSPFGSFSGLDGFDPLDLDINVNPDRVVACMEQSEYAAGLLVALRLGERDLIETVILSTPISEMPFVVSSLPFDKYVQPLMASLASMLEKSKEIERLCMWIARVFSIHGRSIRSTSLTSMPQLRSLSKSLTLHHNSLERLCQGNLASMDVLLTSSKMREKIDSMSGGDLMMELDSATHDTEMESGHDFLKV